MTFSLFFPPFPSWYLKAQQIAPKNGRPYNQLALLAIYTVRCSSCKDVQAQGEPLGWLGDSIWWRKALFRAVLRWFGFFLRRKKKADGRMCCVDSSCCGFMQLCQTHATPSGILGTVLWAVESVIVLS